MKKLLLSIATLLVCAMSFVACKTDTPKAAAEKFLNGLYHMDYETAKSVSTEQTKGMLDLMAQFSTMMPDSAKTEAKKIKVTIKDEKIEGDKATVTYTSSEDGNKMERKLELVKGGEDAKENKGKWLVAWNKDDGMGGDAGQEKPADTPAEEPTDTTVAPPADNIADTATAK
ncbi:MAG TPA: NTF2-like N-terminal transpeptidase domain-containing protein [Flavipsychrobacter sp.]|nr:NTF2-like N-terminal transpeptidase domain-containing protein [Flavipsychrobacter sp.]